MNTRLAISVLLALSACVDVTAPGEAVEGTDGGAAPAQDQAPHAPPAWGSAPDAAPRAAVDAGFAGDDAGDGGPASATCDRAAPPRDGLVLWLRAGEGVTAEGGRVRAWEDQSGGAPAIAPTDDQRPTLVANALAGKPILHFEGGRQALQRTTPIDGLRELTVAFVNATPVLWKDGQDEWCHHDGCDPKAGRGVRVVSETGCSGTYEHVLWWNGTADWTGVYLSPKQEEVAFRFGNGAKTYSNDPCSMVHDVQVAWPRPASVRESFSLTVAVHDRLENRLYVQGREVLRLPVPGGAEATVRAGDRLDIGNGFGWVEGTNHGGDVAEVLVYRRALPDAERRALESYVACNLFPGAALEGAR